MTHTSKGRQARSRKTTRPQNGHRPDQDLILKTEPVVSSRRYLLTQLRIALGEEQGDLSPALARVLGGQARDYQQIVVERQSLDARHKNAAFFLITLSFNSTRAQSLGPRSGGLTLEWAPEVSTRVWPRLPKPPQVVVVGTGPAGSFCALRLLQYGIRPIVIERGPAMPQRIAAVEALWRGGELNPEANAQFGEGGAGTFSDGKLSTRIKHPEIRWVLEQLVGFGASAQILSHAHPHVGTDVIRGCSVALREHAKSKGAEYRFLTQLTEITCADDGKINAARLHTGDEIPCDAIVLALGHSARDTFAMLHGHHIALAAKPFAMGLRIEHPQALIDEAQYGPRPHHPSLPPADYRLAHNFDSERAVYSFCMCPGGEVIQCSSEPGCVVVNGMSLAARDSGWANSGIVAKVSVADFAGEGPLAGIEFQRRWERAAFAAAGKSYGAPASSVQDFLAGHNSGRLPRQNFRRRAIPADLRRCLPEVVTTQLLQALPIFDRTLHGFTSSEALLLGIESRTSSPLRILRGEDGQSVSHPGLYPCGEGAGYAGGITSAAVDGLRVADRIAQAHSV